MLPTWKKTKKKKRKGNASLVKKLDRVFALYIRLRDAMPSGVFRCISCGRILPFEQSDCGHFYSRTHMATRFDEKNCWAECRHCLTPDALILTKDLRWVRLGDLNIGDEIFAFDEGTKGVRRKWRVGVVTHVHREVQDVYDVELENGDHIKTTANHKWLTRSSRNHSFDWVATKDMWINGINLSGNHKTGPHTDRVTTIVCKPFLLVEQELSFESGWLSGMIDADGHICQQNIHDPDGTIRYGFRVGVAQSETYPLICKEIVRLIEKFTGNNKPCRQSMDKQRHRNIPSRVRTWQFLITGTNIEKIQFLMRIRPKKMSKVDINKLGLMKSQYDVKVKSITYVGKEEIVVMETDTHTFIANGYAMHNCNRMSADHIIAYRDNLVEKIGLEGLERLKILAHSTVHWQDFELEEKIAYYTAEVKRLSAEKGIKVNL